VEKYVSIKPLLPFRKNVLKWKNFSNAKRRRNQSRRKEMETINKIKQN
jgi:hypothetical protein